VRKCDIYLGIFGNEYGNIDAEGISPTEREYDFASQLCKTRLIFIKNNLTTNRDEREKALITKAENEVVRKSFQDINSLRTAVYASLIHYLEYKEIIRIFPFDASKDTNTTLNDLNEDKIRDFIYVARRKRNFPLQVDTLPEKLLTHLDLIDDAGRIKNAAILLFGKKPQIKVYIFILLFILKAILKTLKNKANNFNFNETTPKNKIP
jgi:predicted HTH transcriptional regulator